MEADSVRAGWRFSTKAPGGPCVTTIGTPRMPTWCAGSWAVAGPRQLPEVLVSARARGPFSWTTWAAQGTSPTCGAACTEAGTLTIATTGRTLVSSAPVGLPDIRVLFSYGSLQLHAPLCTGLLPLDFLGRWAVSLRVSPIAVGDPDFIAGCSMIPGGTLSRQGFNVQIPQQLF